MLEEKNEDIGEVAEQDIVWRRWARWSGEQDGKIDLVKKERPLSPGRKTSDDTVFSYGD